MSNLPKNQSSKKPIPIDVLVSVVDNLGDIGFAAELMIAYHGLFPHDFCFRIFTDRRELVQGFFDRNHLLLGNYEVYDYVHFLPEKSSSVIFSLFHFPLPDFQDEVKRLVLRFDYLSLNPEWIRFHGNDHIKSNNCTKIIEIIPSPFPESGGLLQHSFSSISREQWLEKNNFPVSFAKGNWIFMFIYGSTIERIDWDSFNEDRIFVFSDAAPNRENIIKLPLLDIESFYELMILSDIICTRGEVSFVQALQLGKPFLWDMYKERGGFYDEQSEQFLDSFGFDAQYRSLHAILNGCESGKINRVELMDMAKNFPMISGRIGNTKNLVQESKKYIDRFYFSL